MNLSPDNAVQFYIDVRKASGKDSPTSPDFYKVALDRRDNKLVQALNSIDEQDFLKPEKLINSLRDKYFGSKQDISKPKSWVSRILRNKAAKKEKVR